MGGVPLLESGLCGTQRVAGGHYVIDKVYGWCGLSPDPVGGRESSLHIRTSVISVTTGLRWRISSAT